jgi:hypothetical protein
MNISKIEVHSSWNAVNADDDNIDVFVRLDNGELWTATFFTISNIETLLNRYKVRGECLHGQYVWAKAMIIVRSLTAEGVRDTLEELHRTGELFAAMVRVEG